MIAETSADASAGLSADASASSSAGRSADAERARLLADVAGLPLGPGRAEIAGELLAEWLPDAIGLARKMSAAEHMNLLPVTVFAHAPVDDDA